MDNKKPSRIITVQIPADIEAYKTFASIIASHFNHDWKISSTLDPLPQLGETWKNALGEIFTLGEKYDASKYSLFGINSNCTWTADGIYDVSETTRNRECNVRNLVERCAPPLCINVGELWEDRSGNIHKIKIICPSERYAIKSTLDYTWTMSGQYDVECINGKLDLIKRVHVVDCCNKGPL